MLLWAPDGTNAACGASGLLAAVDRPWFALRTIANHERRVTHRLLTEGVCPYLPLYGSPRRWSDRIHYAQRPLFPGYVFAQLAPDDIARALECLGVLYLLPSNQTPLAVPGDQIEQIRILVNSGQLVDEAEWQPGAVVDVVSGPLAGARGVLAPGNLGRPVLLVQIEILGRALAVEVDRSCLRKTK